MDIGDGDKLKLLTLWDIIGYTDVLKPHMEKHHKLGHHVIISAEQYAAWDTNMTTFFERTCLPRADTGDNDNDPSTGTYSKEPLFQFRVKIVVIYRHFFEWLPSLYW